MMQLFEELEAEFSKWIGGMPCVAVSSGTAALHLALEALELPPGSFVDVPDIAMVACPRSVVMAGHFPRFVRCDDESLLIDPRDIKSSVVMPVHLYGRQVDLNQTQYLGRVVVEDLAEAHGVMPHKGSAAACWSFYKNKIVHGEEGGMIAFRNPQHAEVARELRSLGFDSNHNFMHRPRGVNARMSNLHAAPILVSLRNVSNNLEKRKQLAMRYEYYIPSKWLMPVPQSHWVFSIRIKSLTQEKQDELIRLCRKRGIEARHCFKPMSMQKEFKTMPHENSLDIAREVVYLPINDTMGFDSIDYNAQNFMDICLSLKII